jgi:hypothetical protein
MADGSRPFSRRLLVASSARALTLTEACRPGRRLVAICRCGERAAVPTEHWLELHLGALRLSTFETRLRCICGARQVAFEVWIGEPPQGAAITLFR